MEGLAALTRVRTECGTGCLLSGRPSAVSPTTLMSADQAENEGVRGTHNLKHACVYSPTIEPHPKPKPLTHATQPHPHIHTTATTGLLPLAKKDVYIYLRCTQSELSFTPIPRHLKRPEHLLQGVLGQRTVVSAYQASVVALLPITTQNNKTNTVPFSATLHTRR